jgi:hypothetical protein
MADIPINFIIPDAYTQRLKDAIDILDPPGTLTYKELYITLIRRWSIQYIQQAELQGRDITVDDEIITET